MRLTVREIYEAARAAGFTPDQATTWTAIALAESGGETGALNDSGEHSVGLWQINVAPEVRANTWGDLHDPMVNARAAYEISRRGADMRPWTTTHASRAGTSTDYRTHLDEVSAVTGYSGDPRGVDGYGAPLRDPLPPSGPEVAPAMATSASYDPILAGADPGAQLDTDQDGLTDAFERLAGSSPDVADTDQDGLSDAYELVVSGTDPLLADSDRDGLSDATEQSLGTSPTRWDSDSDGASDAVEVSHGSDPLHAENGTVPQPVVTTAASLATGTTTAGTVAAPAAGTMPAGTMTAASTRADAFVATAQAQRGDSYVFGAEASLDDSDPDSFDCSELTQWAAHQVGVTIPDGAMYQYLELKGEGQLMSVEEALNTKGALLFYFSSEPTPGGGRPSSAHVAISLGDGRTIEAKGSSYGVNEFPAAGRFNYAGMIPEMAGPAEPGMWTQPATMFDAVAAGPIDSDGDGLSDAFEQMIGFDPLSADSDSNGMDDALEHLGAGGSSAATVAAPAPPPSPAEIEAALVQQGLDAAGDADDDGLSNYYEIEHRLDPTSQDTDADGLTDSTEIALGTDPTALDSDADGLSDRLELELGTDPLQRGTPQDQWGLLGEGPDPAPEETEVDPVDLGGDLD